jgi:hypothetical protein
MVAILMQTYQPMQLVLICTIHTRRYLHCRFRMDKQYLNKLDWVFLPMVSIGNIVASSQVDFGTSAQFRQVIGNLTFECNSHNWRFRHQYGGDLQIGGTHTNTAGSTFNHNNSRAVTFMGTCSCKILILLPITFAYLNYFKYHCNVTSFG